MQELDLRPFSSSMPFSLQMQGNLFRMGSSIIFQLQGKGEVESLLFPRTPLQKNNLSRPSSRKRELWNTTCFEFFLKNEGQEGYYEFNFSPSGYWNCYSFTGYRQGMLESTEVDGTLLQQSFLPQKEKFSFHSELSFGPVNSGKWLYSVSAVLEWKNGIKTYMAPIHPRQDVPDFHHQDNFIHCLS